MSTAELQTRGISPKAVGALAFPLIAAAGAAVASWIVTGDFSDSEIRTAASGVVLAGIAAVGAYTQAPGSVYRSVVSNPPK